MKHYYLLFFASFLLSLQSNSQSLDYAQRFNRNNEAKMHQLYPLQNDEVLVLGSFVDSLQFKGTQANYNLNISGTNCYGSFLAKLNANGEAVWLKEWRPLNSSNTFVYINRMNVGSNGQIKLFGSLIGAADLDPGVGSQMENTPASFFILDLDAQGNYLNHWVLNSSNPSPNLNLLESSFNNILELSNGDLLIGGVFSGTLDTDPSPAIDTLSASNEQHFLIRLDSNLNLLHSRTYPNLEDEWNSKIYEGADGRLYAMGITSASMSEYIILQSDLSIDSIVDVSQNGVLDFSMNANDEVVFIGDYGPFTDFDFSSGTSSSQTNIGKYVAKYDNLLLSNQWRQLYRDSSQAWRLTAVEYRNQNDLHIIGNYDFPVSLTNNYANPLLNNPADNSMFWLRLDSSGIYQSIYPTTVTSANSFAIARTEVVDGVIYFGDQDKLYLNFWAVGPDVDLDPFSPIVKIGNPYTNLLKPSFPDLAIQKINLNGITSIKEDAVLSEGNFTIYPNPAGTFINIISNQRPALVTIYDLNGKKVLSPDYQGRGIDVSSLTSGVYLIELVGQDGQRSIQKFIKEE